VATSVPAGQTQGDLQYDATYPYAPRPAAPSPSERPARRQILPWRALWRWSLRAAAIVGAALLIVTIVVGVFAYRAARQAWLIADLERQNSTIVYDQPTGNESSLSTYLRESYGDAWWGDVREVSLRTDGYWSSFFYPPISDDVASFSVACGRFSKLRKFEVASEHFSCRYISNWPHLENLEELVVESANLTDADLATIGRMIGLKRLRLGTATITGEGLGHLSRLPNLESLTLSKVQLTSSKLSPESGFQALKSLVIGQSLEFDDKAIGCFGSPPNLEEINFNRTLLGDNGLAQLMKSGKVRSLIVNDGQVTDAGLASLTNYAAPRWLVLSGMPLTDQGLKALGGHEFPVLVLDRTVITDEGFRTLANVKGLEYVCLANTKVNGTGVSALGSDAPLKHLDLSGAPLTRAGIQALANANISELDLSQTAIGDQELLLFANSDTLTSLDVQNTSVTYDGVRTLYKTRRSRLKSAGAIEKLSVICDFPGVAASVLGFDPASGIRAIAP